MKKNILALFIAISASSFAMAADNAGTAITGPVSTTDCSLLSEQVTLNLSNSVFGAYACNTTANVVAVATCHPTGRKGNVDVSCNPVADPAATPAYVPPAGCVVRSGGSGPTDGVMQVQGGLAFTASTSGGTVQGVSAAACRTGGSTTAEAAAAAGL